MQGAGAHGWVAAAVEADPRGTAAALASDKLRLGATLDISGLPGLELLSLKVCCSVLTSRRTTHLAIEDDSALFE